MSGLMGFMTPKHTDDPQKTEADVEMQVEETQKAEADEQMGERSGDKGHETEMMKRAAELYFTNSLVARDLGDWDGEIDTEKARAIAKAAFESEQAAPSTGGASSSGRPSSSSEAKAAG